MTDLSPGPLKLWGRYQSKGTSRVWGSGLPLDLKSSTLQLQMTVVWCLLLWPAQLPQTGEVQPHCYILP
jgi:hypothetical protein